jgi:AbiU2
MMKPADIDRHVRSLQDTVTAAELNFEIWWVYKSQDTRPKYIDSMNRYLAFFEASIHAHFVANVIALYRLYEDRRDSINLNRLLRALPTEKQSKLPSDFDARMDRAKQIWKKLSIVRNNCFGHLNGESSVAECFKRAALTPNEIKELVEVTKGILNDVTHVWNGSVHAFNLNDAHNDTVRLLDDLNRLARDGWSGGQP